VYSNVTNAHHSPVTGFACFFLFACMLVHFLFLGSSVCCSVLLSRLVNARLECRWCEEERKGVVLCLLFETDTAHFVATTYVPFFK
jgi:hypothetical protein